MRAYARIFTSKVSPEELGVMVQEGAYRRGVKVMAHAQGLEGIKNATMLSCFVGPPALSHGIQML